jgi:DNA-binding transcriptional regulator YiaG
MTTIREARQAAGLSQQGVTDTLGIPKRTLQDWESGKRTPPGWAAALVIEKLGKIAQGNKKNSENPVDNTSSIC